MTGDQSNASHAKKSCHCEEPKATRQSRRNVTLIERVTHVSIETMRLLDALPPLGVESVA